MAKLTLNNVDNLENESSSIGVINANNDAIEAAIENTLSRDGTGPNQMTAPLDMNSQRIINLPAPVSGGEPLRLTDLETLGDGDVIINAIPPGGLTNQVLYKVSDSDFDVSWINADDVTTGNDPGRPFVILNTGQSYGTQQLALGWAPPTNCYLWDWNGNDGAVGSQYIPMPNTYINIPNKMAADIAELMPERDVYLINICFSGQPISKWKSGATSPNAFGTIQANIAPALAALGVTKIHLFSWMQGQGDCVPLNANYTTDHATVMDRFFTDTSTGGDWFHRETQCLIFSIQSVADSGGANADADNMNIVLQGVVNADPDYRRYVNLTSATGSDYYAAAHPTALGASTFGAQAARVAITGSGRGTTPTTAQHMATKQVILGNITYPADATTKLTVNGQGVQAVLPAPITSTQVEIVGPDTSNNNLSLDSFGGFNNIIGRRANGTLASKSAVAANDTLMGMGAQGYQSNGTYTGGNKAAVSLKAGEAWSGTANGTYVQVFTTPNTTTSPVEAARFQGSGALSVGTAAAARDVGTNNLDVSGAIYTKVPQIMTGTSGTASSDVSTIIIQASGTFTLTLPAAGSNGGRWFFIKSINAQIVNHGTPAIVPKNSSTAGTALFGATAGSWAILQSDGTTGYQIMASGT